MFSKGMSHFFFPVSSSDDVAIFPVGGLNYELFFDVEQNLDNPSEADVLVTPPRGKCHYPEYFVTAGNFFNNSIVHAMSTSLPIRVRGLHYWKTYTIKAMILCGSSTEFSSGEIQTGPGSEYD